MCVHLRPDSRRKSPWQASSEPSVHCIKPSACLVGTFDALHKFPSMPRRDFRHTTKIPQHASSGLSIHYTNSPACFVGTFGALYIIRCTPSLPCRFACLPLQCLRRKPQRHIEPLRTTSQSPNPAHHSLVFPAFRAGRLARQKNFSCIVSRSVSLDNRFHDEENFKKNTYCKIKYGVIR